MGNTGSIISHRLIHGIQLASVDRIRRGFRYLSCRHMGDGSFFIIRPYADGAYRFRPCIGIGFAVDNATGRPLCFSGDRVCAQRYGPGRIGSCSSSDSHGIFCQSFGFTAQSQSILLVRLRPGADCRRILRVGCGRPAQSGQRIVPGCRGIDAESRRILPGSDASTAESRRIFTGRCSIISERCRIFSRSNGFIAESRRIVYCLYNPTDRHQIALSISAQFGKIRFCGSIRLNDHIIKLPFIVFNDRLSVFCLQDRIHPVASICRIRSSIRTSISFITAARGDILSIGISTIVRRIRFYFASIIAGECNRPIFIGRNSCNGSVSKGRRIPSGCITCAERGRVKPTGNTAVAESGRPCIGRSGKVAESR